MLAGVADGTLKVSLMGTLGSIKATPQDGSGTVLDALGRQAKVSEKCGIFRLKSPFATIEWDVAQRTPSGAATTLGDAVSAVNQLFAGESAGNPPLIDVDSGFVRSAMGIDNHPADPTRWWTVASRRDARTREFDPAETLAGDTTIELTEKLPEEMERYADLAENSSHWAQRVAIVLHALGLGGFEKNEEKAFALARSLATRGDGEAKTLTSIREYITAVKAKDSLASGRLLADFERSAATHDAIALMALESIYRNGLGVVIDKSKADRFQKLQTKALAQRGVPLTAPVAKLCSFTPSEFTNSLGMEFVPLPGSFGAFICRTETRVRDYREFAQATNRDWPKPRFEQTDDHPAVNVSWEDAVAFCEWLSKKEGWTYRLPTDSEWSMAVGLENERGGTPEAKDGKATEYPWGPAWPPPNGVGNYAEPVRVDSFQYTCKVGLFPPNRYGLYDMGGNVWEWCQDWYEGAPLDHESASPNRVLRGASWFYYNDRQLRSSYRYIYPLSDRFPDVGFRCVVSTR